MATNYPGSLDTGTEQPSPLSTTEMDDAGFEHDVVHTNHSGAIIALETKVGTGSSTAVADSVLAGTGAGTSAWTTGTLANDISGNAATATSLATARTIDITGDITATAVAFDGTANIAISASVNNDSHTHDTRYYTEAESDAKYLLNTTDTLSGNLTVTGIIDVDEVRGDNGTNADPTFTFTDDQDTGMYRYGANAIGWACGGSLRLMLDNSGDGRLFGPGFRTGSAIIRGEATAATPVYTFYADENTGMYRYAADKIGFSTGGAYRAHIESNGLHLASGDWFRTYGSAGWYSQTYGGGWYMTDTSWVRAYNGKGVLTTGNFAGVNASTSSTSGWNYILRSSVYTSFAYYTSSRDVKENIVDVTAADSGAWIDALQPVQFNERYLGEGEEPEAERTWREADTQVGFIAEDVLNNPVTSQFSQIKDNGDGTLSAVGWKWECVIAAAVAEIKSLRARVAALEAA